MLIALRVHNFILIEALELRLEPGYNVLTGETGAGKSIVIGALGLVLGGRARADMVRPGANEAEVEALFDVGGHEVVRELLREAGLPDDDELVIRRVVQPNGRSRAYLNGRLCTVSQLTALAPELADVTSQHESVALTDPRRHLDYLDRYARLMDARAQLGEAVDELLGVVGEMRRLAEAERSHAEREGFLRYQLGTLDEVAPQVGELAALQAERARLQHTDLLQSTSTRVAQQLDCGEGALCDELARVVADVARLAEVDADLSGLAAEVEDCWSRLRDIAAQMARYAEGIEAEPGRLDAVNDRLYRLRELLRQHGPTEDDALATRARIAEELAAVERSGDRWAELEAERARRLARAAAMARRLSASRKKAATHLAAAITSRLADLGMGRARVLVELTPFPVRGEAEPPPASDRRPVQPPGGGEGSAAPLVVDDARLTRDGVDRVQFLIAPNPGLEPQPLRRIASGGELSRSLLALKGALGAFELGGFEHQSSCERASGAVRGGRAVGVQVFDEVDAGVGGATADKIGRAIADIAAHRQVLCITHLAPIAAYGDAHFVIAKEQEGGATVSRIERVVGERRVAEVTRMLTGEAASEPSRRAAEQLLEGAAAAVRTTASAVAGGPAEPTSIRPKPRRRRSA